jgi:hypothetical protein
MFIAGITFHSDVVGSEFNGVAVEREFVFGALTAGAEPSCPARSRRPIELSYW